MTNVKPSVVLVHGGFVDGAGWEGVYRILKKDGYDVSIVQNPTLNLPRGRGERARVEEKAELVLGRDRRSDDPACVSAVDGAARPRQ